MHNMQDKCILFTIVSKIERHNLLIDIIESGRVKSQAQLVSHLRRAGHEVTQASVSRDLDELGIYKTDGVYARQRNVGNDLGEVTFETAGGCLIVGHCASGLASAVTVRIDRMTLAGIVGTIAGDDTIFIAVKEGRSQAGVLQGLKRIFG